MIGTASVPGGVVEEQVLAGVRVLEVAQWWFVPSAGAVLADWGAEVVKVEHPRTGDPQRGLVTSGLVPKGGFNFMWEQPNRGKKSVGIDLRVDAGRELLYELAARSDVFLTSFLPEARRRLRIDVEDLRAVNPKIIYARGSGQGVRGPDAERGGYDGASFWARGGVAAALSHDPSRPPVGQRPAFGDGIGGMTIAGGIAAALFRRERTGEPSVVDISLLATAMWTLAPDITMARALSALAGRTPTFDRRMAPNPIVNAYPTKDGRWIMLIMLQSDRNWPDLCRHLGRPDLIDDPRFADSAKRFENRAECVDTLDGIFLQRTLEEWKQVLATTDGVWAPVQRPIELYDDPQVLANGYLPDVELGDGTRCQLVNSPVQFDETPARLAHAPECGQDTEQVLLDLGLDWDAIAGYKKSGAIL
jgi:crotonobetainyl-CoA:carnitine CoA-transferase CaiB-like acyl-CoA transferase